MAALVLMAITGCDPCYNVECDAPDVFRINGLKFRFDTQNSFSISEVDSAYILLFNKGNWNDPVSRYSYQQDLKQSEDGTFMLKAGFPFAEVQDLEDWNYVIYPNVGETVYRISSVHTEGYYPTDCCCCYRNRTKTFQLNNSSIERSGSEDAVILNR